ncbi:MAG: helix-turn-helix domain-containing protein [Treponema sp.]|jgi:transcriptional regulator with XRE-family HTH domain|nr:helix-turn-helix domain-containing protein [Treponema sp.]
MVDSENMVKKAEIETQISHIAERLREEREKLRISQMDLSFKAGLSQNQVNYIETGKRTPNLYTVLSICKALQISPAVLFEEQDAERKEARETVINLVSRFM